MPFLYSSYLHLMEEHSATLSRTVPQPFQRHPSIRQHSSLTHSLTHSLSTAAPQSTSCHMPPPFNSIGFHHFVDASMYGVSAPHTKWMYETPTRLGLRVLITTFRLHPPPNQPYTPTPHPVVRARTTRASAQLGVLAARHLQPH